jgi:CubicO group peptidase (beta-lactamase class C family)
MEQVERLLDAIVEQGRVPSASLVVRREGHEAFHRTVGLARLDPARRAAEDQPYDLASVTKALVASTVTAALVEDGVLKVDGQVADIVPDVDPRITLGHLLTHASGLPAWRAFYEEVPDAWGLAETRRAIQRAARSTPVEAPPGERHTYSDVGMIALLALIEEVTGTTIDVLFRERVLDRAGVEDLRWGWPNAAATERCPVRGTLIEGTVHDLNCAAMGGISTHAGLFGPARAVAELAEKLMDAVREPDACAGLPGRTLGWFWRLRGPGSHRGVWDSITPGASSTGRFFPADSIGHLGYTGTSVWIVPSRRVVVALLTNRVHPVDDKSRIQHIRPEVHDAVATALGWAG